MGDRSLDWSSFWDVVTPQRAAQMLLVDFGDAAIGAATQCALAAQVDERAEDASFWRAVIAELGDIGQGASIAQPLANVPRPTDV